MASYFDLPPARSKAAAAPTAELNVPENSGFGRMSLLSPQVSAILDDLELGEKSSSDEEKASHSRDSNPLSNASSDHRSRPHKSNLVLGHGSPKAQASSLPQPSKTIHKAASPRPSVGGHKHPHLARFHSLRSMLFQSNIEANLHHAKEKGAKDDPEDQWKAEHEKRQGLNRPKTPDSPPKQGFAQKLGNSLRRLTSKDVPTMNSIKEVADDNESTASDDEEDEQRRAAEDSEDIDHSDIEDIVRWVSRRDPPSDGERGKSGTGVTEPGKEDSGHESFGNSDVDDLVRWISRKDNGPTKALAANPKQEAQIINNGESDASTQSDSEDEPMDEDEVDDLVRWVSRREGPNAGPIREKKSTATRQRSAETPNEHDEELERWKTREDDASGESDVPDEFAPQTSEDVSLAKHAKRAEGSSLKAEVLAPSARESNTKLVEEDVDELVQWASKKKLAQI